MIEKYRHVHDCDTPSTFMRRIGAVWCCPRCRGLWVMIRIYGGGYSYYSYKAWKPVEEKADA